MYENKSIIDNEQVILLEQLRNILPDTKRASIAVGYFFISGFAAIMDSISKIENSGNPDHVIRLLISPTTNRATAEALLASNESFAKSKKEGEKVGEEGESVENAKEQIRKTLEYMPQTEQDNAATLKLMDLIRKKKLQVKVYTKDQLHAKAYVFELDNRQLPIMGIVGSSNLSISGIKEHAELNLRTNDPGHSQELLDWFDRHWEDPSTQEFTKEIADIIGKSWAGKSHKPVDIYNKAVIYEYDDLAAIRIPHPKEYGLYGFQKAAVSRAIRKLDEYGGVIIADVVGTGKTFIGSAILKHLRETKRSKPLIICPPHLIDMWKGYLRDFELYGEIESRYKIGMGDTLAKYEHCDAVLVDESHNFRNTNTNSYEALLAFMEEKSDDSYMIMLTATPISNGPNDLKNQLRLFPAGKLSNVPPLGNTTLDEYFKKVMVDGKITEEGAARIRELLRHVLVRRTRTHIMDKYAKHDERGYYLESGGEKKYFPKRRLHNPEEYDADMVYSSSFDAIQRYIGNLKLARYAPGNYVKEEYLEKGRPGCKKYRDLASTTLPLSGIVRTSLLKRMESSIAAFSDSIEKYLKGYKEFKTQLNQGRVPIGKEFHDEIYKKISLDDDDDYDETRISDIQSQYEIEAFDVAQWQADIADDLTMFAGMKEMLVPKEKFTKHDDKLHKLRDLLESLKTDKILVFTESAVTARYIYGYLKDVSGRKMAQIDSSQGTKEKNRVIRRFDPKNNNATDISREDELDVLISTDVLSEGVNLQSGRIVINYDFHWNPVRLIQRVGRVDRIGSEHRMIDIFNFLPTTQIDASLSLMDRVKSKIEAIRQIIGHDQKILMSTEPIDSEAVSNIYNNDEAVFEPKDGGILDPESESEQDADEIRKDGDEFARVQGMQFGIRSSVGRGKLLVACEAEEDIVNSTGEIVSKQYFRRHYEVTENAYKRIWPLLFLKQLKEYSKNPPADIDGLYNNRVSYAWNVFNREIKNSIAKSRMLKHQNHFETELRRITDDKDLGVRARLLMPFIQQRMVANHQPYRLIIDLRKRLSHDPNAGVRVMVEELEKIRQNNNVTYHKTIKKPRILYSLMVSA